MDGFILLDHVGKDIQVISLTLGQIVADRQGIGDLWRPARDRDPSEVAAAETWRLAPCRAQPLCRAEYFGEYAAGIDTVSWWR